jgi:hypothetical protein
MRYLSINFYLAYVSRLDKAESSGASRRTSEGEALRYEGEMQIPRRRSSLREE